jgi:hypothetical protein
MQKSKVLHHGYRPISYRPTAWEQSIASISRNRPCAVYRACQRARIGQPVRNTLLGEHDRDWQPPL